MPVMTASSADVYGAVRSRVTRGAGQNALMSADPGCDVNSEGWTELIASRLVAWEFSTKSLDDGDSIPPTPTSIATALYLARNWRANGNECPIDIVPDGDGGIVFKIPAPAPHEFSINVRSDGSVDQFLFDGQTLVSHQHFPGP